MFESILGVMVESMQGSQVYLECTGTQGILERLRPPPLEGRQECWDSFPDEAGKWTLISRCRGKNGALLELWQDPWCSSVMETGMSGNFWFCIRGAKDPFKAQEGRWDFSRDAAVEKGLISR